MKIDDDVNWKPMAVENSIGACSLGSESSLPNGGATGELYTRRAADGTVSDFTRIVQVSPLLKLRPYRIFRNVIAKESELFFTPYEMIKLIRLPELSGKLARRRSDGCTVHLPLRRQATSQDPANLRRGEMFPRRALFKHRLLTSKRGEQVDMIWHDDRIREDRSIAFEMQETVQNDLREL